MQDLNELKLLIANKLDILEFLDIIGFTIYDLVDVLEEVISENDQELARACE